MKTSFLPTFIDVGRIFWTHLGEFFETGLLSLYYIDERIFYRQATIVSSLVTFNYVEQWLLKCLSIPNSTCGLTFTDPFYQEWEALANFIESVLSR